MAQVYNKGDLHLFHVMAKVTEDQIGLLQLNEYETVPYFIQLSQNLTCDCLWISVFSPEFT